MTALRTCIGSAKFGIEAHDAPPEDFPVQPSQKDGLGRMCRPHWKQYVTALRKASVARKAAEADPVVIRANEAIAEREAQLAAGAPKVTRRIVKTPKPEPIRTRPARGRKTEGDLIVEAVDAANVEEASIA